MTFRILLLALMMFMLSACARLAGNPLDDEALKEASKVLDKKYLKCGQDWIAAYSDVVTGSRYDEFRSPKLEIVPKELTDIDSLNGIDWTGSVRITIGLRRQYHAGQWGDWQDTPPLKDFVFLIHKKGVWDVKYANSFDTPDVDFTCTGIPPN